MPVPGRPFVAQDEDLRPRGTGAVCAGHGEGGPSKGAFGNPALPTRRGEPLSPARQSPRTAATPAQNSARSIAARTAAAAVGRGGGALTPRTGGDRNVRMGGINAELCFPRLNGGMDGTSFPIADDAAPLAQHPLFARALRALGRPVAEVALGEAGRALVLGRGRVALVSRGPVWTPGTGIEARRAGLALLRRRLPRPGLLLVNAEAPDRALPRAGFLPLLTPAWVAEWPLDPDTAARRADLHGKWRNALVRAEAEGWQVTRRPMPPEPSHWLLARDAVTARARGYRPWPPALVAAYAAAPGAAWLWTVARRGSAPAAAILVLRHGAGATYQTGWADAEGRAGGATALLLWEAAGWLAETGTTRFDLGTIDTEGAPGLARFKLGTGAVARPLGGSWGTLRVV